MPSAPAGGTYEWREPVDPNVVGRDAEQLVVEVDRPVGYAEAREHPLSSFGINARIRWNSIAGGLCRYFAELCVRHNSGQISVQEFETRRAELLAATEQVQKRRADFLAAVSEYEREEALLAPEVKPEDRPPGVTPAVARALMADARQRATFAIQEATAAVDRLQPKPVLDAEGCPIPTSEPQDAASPAIGEPQSSPGNGPDGN